MTSGLAPTQRGGRTLPAALALALVVCAPATAQKPPALPPAGAQWLQVNASDPHWPEVCRQFLASSPAPDEIASALGALPAVPPQVDADLALRAAGLLEAAGSPEAALLFYTHAAASSDKGARRTEALLNAAALAGDLGSGDRVIPSIDKALASVSDPRERSDLRALQALLRYDLGDRDLAITDLSALLPDIDPASALRLQVLFALAAHYTAARDSAAAAPLIKQVLEAYPRSPEAAVLSRKAPVTLSAAPRRFLRPVAPEVPALGVQPPLQQPPLQNQAPDVQPQAPTARQAPLVHIQAGSFTVAENAHFMAKDLEKAGFTASVDKVVVSGRTYYRVTLAASLTPEDARHTLIRLKQAGFEGALIP